MKFILLAQLNVNRRAACDFLLENELNTIANAWRRLVGSDEGQRAESLHEIDVKRADLGGFDAQVSAEYSPAH